MKERLILLVVMAVFLNSCSENEFTGQYPTDDTPPVSITSPTVENTPGGAIITYDIPDDEDLLYVQAIYERNGNQIEQKASAYKNSLVIEGFGKSAEHRVQLIAYDRSDNASPSVEVTIHPLDAPIYTIMESLQAQNDFGGIRLDWENPTEADVVVSVITPNNIHGIEELTEAETFYSKAKIGRGNVRGYQDEERIFGIFARDPWGNYTDTLMATYQPIFEVEVDKSKFRRWNPPGIPYNGYTSANWWIENLWDGKIGSLGVANNQGFANTTSLEFTLDMGQTAKLSRFKINQRSESHLIYNLGHPKRFQLWGSPHPNVNQDFDNWIFLGEFESIKPSGLPLGQVSDEDIRYAWETGEDWNVPLEAPPVRYLRFVAQETWGNGSAVQVMEMTLWGDNKY
ncbi:DUF5000 domain-containing lipoprotein [Parapedobacter sp.]